MEHMRFSDEILGLEGTRVTLARAISRLTPAPLINLYVGLIMSFLPPKSLGPVLNGFSSILICIVFMVILPVAPIMFSAWRGKIDLDVSARRMRPRFLLFAMMCYSLAYVVYWWTLCDVMRVLAAAYFTVTSGVLIGTLVTKISVHGAGVGGPGTALIYVYGPVALLIIVVWIAVVWSRTELRQHTMLQTVGGVVLAILITWLTYLWLYI
ncbi:MAG: hypothetical protein JSW61_00325 [Candidatus Thorarchaeota archaeon]|nr:MAG: hypothetical protein JSW61_00325 [Candidatus Thorarchaeota archaeon]